MSDISDVPSGDKDVANAPSAEASSPPPPPPSSPKKSGTPAKPTPPSRSSSPTIEVKIVNLLLLATTVNFVLIFGGTLYAKFKVESIQQAYHDAQLKVDESASKFKQAAELLERQRAATERAIADAGSVIVKASELEGQIQTLQRQGAQVVREMTNEAEKETGRVAERVGLTLKSIDQKQRELVTRLDETGNVTITQLKGYPDELARKADKELKEIDRQRQEVSVRIAATLKLVEDQKGAADKLELDTKTHLFAAQNAERDLEVDLKELRQSGKLSLLMAWEHSNNVVRAFLVGMCVLALASFALAFMAIRKGS